MVMSAKGNVVVIPLEAFAASPLSSVQARAVPSADGLLNGLRDSHSHGHRFGALHGVLTPPDDEGWGLFEIP